MGASREERPSTQLGAIDPPLSSPHAAMRGLNKKPYRYSAHIEQSVHPQINLFRMRGLMNQAAMVHKRPPAAGDSPAATASERIARGKHLSADCGRARRSRTAGRGDGDAARRRRHRSVRGALPQGNHRRARRRAIAHAGRAPELSARTRRAPHRDPQFGPRTGQARCRAGSRDPRRRQQGPAGRHLSAVQAEAPHQGRDRQGGRAGAAGRTAADAAAERSDRSRPSRSSMPKSRWPMPPPRSTARAPFWSSASPKTPI